MHMSMLPFLLERNQTIDMSLIGWNRSNEIMEMELR